MNRVAQSPRQLAQLAQQISARHDEDCLCFEEPFVQDQCSCTTNLPKIEMDARERKWAAQKLLRPIEDDPDCEDFTIQDWIEVARHHWILRRASHGPEQSALERFQFSARQLQHTTARVRAVWGLSAGNSAANADHEVTSDGDFDDCDEADFLDSVDMKINYSSDPDDEAPHETGKDANGNRVKLF